MDLNFEEQLRIAAEQVGLIFIKRHTEPSMRKFCVYRFEKCGHEQSIQYGAVKRNNFRCRACYEKRYTEDATRIGLTYLGQSERKGKYRLYRCNHCGFESHFRHDHVATAGVSCSGCLKNEHNSIARKSGLKFLQGGGASCLFQFESCGHLQTIAMGNVKAGKFSCSTCRGLKYEKEAKEAGVEIIGEAAGGKEEGKRYYRFISCGHEAELYLAKVRQKNISCSLCGERTYIDEARRVGLQLIGDAGKGYRLYRFNKCGHEKTASLAQVRLGNVECKLCGDAERQKEAHQAGLTLIGESTRGNAYRKYLFACGHQKDIQVASVRRKSVLCTTCNETYRDVPSMIYLVLISLGEFSFLKLGYAKDIDTRVKKYQLPASATHKILGFSKHGSGHDAYKLEAQLHTELREQKLDKDDMKSIMQSGFDECYPVEAKPLLIDALQRLTTKKEAEAFVLL